MQVASDGRWTLWHISMSGLRSSRVLMMKWIMSSACKLGGNKHNEHGNCAHSVGSGVLRSSPLEPQGDDEWRQGLASPANMPSLPKTPAQSGVPSTACMQPMPKPCRPT
eukprot:scaffold161590_cov17-Tisochrysis_lutea.AAC.1